MAAVQRKTDANTGGGTISSTAHGTYPNVHAGVTTANGSSTVFAGGIAINRTGDADSCTHTRTGGSGDVFVG